MLARAEAADQEPLPEGLSIPEELSRREERLAAIRKAKEQIEARGPGPRPPRRPAAAAERDAQEKADFEAKIKAREEMTARTGKKPGGKPPALEEWEALHGSVKEALRSLLRKTLDNPHVPGSRLHGGLANCYKIKLRKQSCRLVYTVEDDVLIVLILAVDKREDLAAYKSAIKRLLAKLTLTGTAVAQPQWLPPEE